MLMPSVFDNHLPSRSPRLIAGLILAVICLMLAFVGCATLRVTDPARTATEQYLMSIATARAVEQLSAGALRDRLVYVDTTYLNGVAQQEKSYLIAELRAKLLLSGVRLMDDRTKAQISLEIRSPAIGIDRLEYLLGIPAVLVPVNTGSSGAVPLTTPELALVKRTTQQGYASAAYVAYWIDTGEVVASSGPYVGYTSREDFWFFGAGPRTTGDIPPAQPTK